MPLFTTVNTTAVWTKQFVFYISGKCRKIALYIVYLTNESATFAHNDIPGSPTDATASSVDRTQYSGRCSVSCRPSRTERQRQKRRSQMHSAAAHNVLRVSSLFRRRFLVPMTEHYFKGSFNYTVRDCETLNNSSRLELLLRGGGLSVSADITTTLQQVGHKTVAMATLVA